nr:KilA-N domain-containing protein [Xenorhabdus sp. TS4]
MENQLTKPQAPQPAVSNIVLITDELGRYKLSALYNASGAKKSKEPSKWLKTRHAKAWVADLSVVSDHEVIHIQKNQGTFAHEILAVEYAGWLSPTFQMQFKQAIGYDRTIIETNVVISVNRPLPKGIYLQNSKTKPYRAVIYSGSETISVGCYPTVEEAVDAQSRYFDTGAAKPVPFRLNADGQYLVTVTNGKVSKYEAVGEKTLVDTEDYWRLRKDINYTEQTLAELKNRMRFIHDERSIASIDYPIHEAISR